MRIGQVAGGRAHVERQSLPIYRTRGSGLTSDFPSAAILLHERFDYRRPGNRRRRLVPLK